MKNKKMEIKTPLMLLLMILSFTVFKNNIYLLIIDVIIILIIAMSIALDMKNKINE